MCYAMNYDEAETLPGSQGVIGTMQKIGFSKIMPVNWCLSLLNYTGP